MFRFAVLLFLLIASTAAFSQATQAGPQFSSLMQELEVVGLAVVAVKNGKIVYAHNFGFHNKEKGELLNDKSIFRIASVSKSFSAVTIMQLIEEKKLSLDDDFSDLVGFTVRNPRYPDRIITLRMIMSHTSSVNDSQGYFNLDVINPAKNPDWKKCYSEYAPGERWSYCNLNYNMVGAVIERLTGERFDVRVRQHILKPLGLYGGYCVDSLDVTRFATLYEYDSVTATFAAAPTAYATRRAELANYQLGYSTPVLSPTGGMKIGAVDLARYMTMHMYDGTYHDVRIMSKKHARLMRKKIADDEGYALGLRESTDLIPGKLMKGHTGNAYGLYSAMFFDPKEKFGFVVITNGCKPDHEADIRLVLRKSISIMYENFIR